MRVPDLPSPPQDVGLRMTHQLKSTKHLVVLGQKEGLGASFAVPGQIDARLKRQVFKEHPTRPPGRPDGYYDTVYKISIVLY
jgi:hypothetical protein